MNDEVRDLSEYSKDELIRIIETMSGEAQKVRKEQAILHQVTGSTAKKQLKSARGYGSY